MPVQNPLFPVFLKLENLRVLLVGGGNVGLEKLAAILRSSPATAVTVVSLTFLPALRALAARHPAVRLHAGPYADSFLESADGRVEGGEGGGEAGGGGERAHAK